MTMDKMEAIRKGGEAWRQKGLRPGPKMSPTERAKKSPKSMRAAVNAYCYTCEGEDADPKWQWRVGNCTIPACPLYGFRPHQSLKGTPVPPSVDPNVEWGRST